LPKATKPERKNKQAMIRPSRSKAVFTPVSDIGDSVPGVSGSGTRDWIRYAMQPTIMFIAPASQIVSLTPMHGIRPKPVTAQPTMAPRVFNP
jgi:hypothetical protein